MKTNKIFTILIAIILTGSFWNCSEDFLKQDPQTSMSNDQLFESLDNVQFFLDGLFFQWRDTRVNRKGFFLMLGTDESQQGEYQMRTDAEQGGLDKYDGFFYNENKPIAQLWSIRWPVVVKAQQGINKLNGLLVTATKEDSVAINSFLGQAYFFKGAVLFELASYWGELPIPTVEGNNVLLSGKKSLQETYQTVEADLMKASALLKTTATASNPRIPTKWASDALLGKLYMSAPASSGLRDFGKAKTILQEIVNKGGFSLVSNFAHLWDGTKSSGKESLYTFLFNNVWPDTNEAQWYTGSRASSGNPTNYIGGYDLILPTEYARTDAGINGLWETGDLRKMESIRYDFYNGSNFPSPVAGFGDDQMHPHIKKYEDKRIDGKESFYRSGKNMYYLRYADILLSLAECMNETGETASAVDLVNNTVRKRAWGGTLPTEQVWSNGMSQDEFRTKIMDERMRELCFEGWRRFDLIRTGNFVDLIKTRNRWAKESGTINQTHSQFPIPITEVKMNPNL